MTRALLLIAMVLAAGCDRMNRQPKLKDYAATDLFADGQAMRQPPVGTAAVDDPAIAAVDRIRPPMTLALLERGRDRYGIYCVTCHDAAGTGRGAVVSRGFSQPRPFTADRTMTDRQIMDAIGEGYGAMYGFADRVPPADRWALTAYVRALQLSQEPSGG